ncbi:MAG: DUF5622 domain-containing protein [Metallosphaera yellowstonensis]|jgi:hypothetical protein|uniref:DUF5622 domain-containing protein n=1 Tax=Metallosphaera yellowstonensis MK1 TaxID=671065 RepID=H2C8H7_9CREN|nr:DUF5622 domain-containing protein [Metallosphaera yellowstonensis]EHP68453.1 hypothetical protein MetMK1DRAFT_00028870 [Metallosphaera yellowstonensis MK1]
MGLKKGKYVYVELDKSRFAKLRVLKKRDEKSPDRYIIINKTFVRRPRSATVVKLEDLPLEIKDRLTNMK